MTGAAPPASAHLVLEAETRSTAETVDLGRRFAGTLRSGDVVVVSGPIGAGKTYFVKGIAAGLGVPDMHAVNSPTYDLVHRFEGAVPLFHLDFYRLEELSPEDVGWLSEYLGGDGVAVIEWGEKFIAAFGRPYYQAEIGFGPGDESRVVAINRREIPPSR